MKNPTADNTLSFAHDKRLLGEFHGTKSSPTVVIIAGIHGNERAGVIATDKVLAKIKADNIAFEGNLYFILGNINALNKGVRFEKVDLNRIWRKDNIEDLFNIREEPLAEVREQLDIYAMIKMIS